MDQELTEAAACGPRNRATLPAVQHSPRRRLSVQQLAAETPLAALPCRNSRRRRQLPSSSSSRIRRLRPIVAEEPAASKISARRRLRPGVCPPPSLGDGIGDLDHALCVFDSNENVAGLGTAFDLLLCMHRFVWLQSLSSLYSTRYRGAPWRTIPWISFELLFYIKKV
jgi:hypothetical protein